MNQVFTFIDKLKEGFLREANLRQYTKPPFNAKEYEGPHSTDAPPFLGGGRNVPAVPAQQPVPGGGNKIPVEVEPPQPVFQAPMEQKKKFTKPKTVMQYYAYFVDQFNAQADNFSSDSPVTPEMVREEIFEPFYLDKVEEIQDGWNDPDKQMKLEAIDKVRSKFDEMYASFQSTGEVVPSGDIEQYPDLTKNDIVAIFENNKKSKKGLGNKLISTVFSEMEKLPEIVNNDNNAALFESLKEELRSSLEKSNLTTGDRKQLFDAFVKGYLGATKNKTPEQNARWFALNSSQINLDEIDDRTIKKIYMQMAEDGKKLGLKPNKSKAGPMSTDINELEFLENELFQSDKLNKDLFLSFFLEPSMIDNTIEIIGEDLHSSDESGYEGDASVLEKNKGRYTSTGMQVLQNHAQVLKNALIRIMTDPSGANAEIRNNFFNWVQKEIMTKRHRAHTGSGEMNAVQQGGSVDGEGNPIGENVERMKDKGWFAKEYHLPIPKEIFKEEGLKKEGPPVTPGDTIDMSTINSLKENWAKMDGFIFDMLNNMEDSYQKIPDNNVKIAMLEKLVFWSRIRKSCTEAVADVAESIRRTGKNLSDKRSIGILNQDWEWFFKEEHWRDFDWSIEGSPDIQIAVERAVADGLASTPEDAFRAMFGKVEFKQNVGTFSKDNPDSKRDQTANSLNQKSYGKVNTLKDFIINPELAAKYGGDTLISFMEMIGYDSSSASIGSLLSKNNRGSIEDKVNYLSRLAQRGVIKKSPVDIENMSPKEVNDVFDGVRETIKLVYSPVGALKNIFQDEASTVITDAQVAQFAQMAGVNKVKSKKDFAKVSKDEKTAIQKAFYDTEYGKYYIDGLGKVESLKAFLTRYVQHAPNDNNFLAANGFATGSDFLAAIGVTDPDPKAIAEQVKKMPQRRVFQITEKFYPKLYEAYNKDLLSKTVAAKDKRIIHEVVDSLIADNKAVSERNADVITPYGKTSPLPEALFYADLFDAKRDLVTAAIRFQLLRKIAMQKKANQTLLLKQRLAKFNVDTDILDGIIAELKHGRRQ